jgi:hypothetical protein
MSGFSHGVLLNNSGRRGGFNSICKSKKRAVYYIKTTVLFICPIISLREIAGETLKFSPCRYFRDLGQETF